MTKEFPQFEGLPRSRRVNMPYKTGRIGFSVPEGVPWLPHDIAKALIAKKRGRSILGSKEWLELMDIRQAYLHLAMFKADMVFGPPSIWSHYENFGDS